MIKKFTVLLIAVIVLLVGAIGLFVGGMLRENNQQVLLDNARNDSAYVSAIVEKFIEGAYNIGMEFSQNPDILTQAPETVTPLLVNLAGNNPYMELVYTVDTLGMQTARSVGDVGDRSTRWWFTQMQETKQPFVSKSYVSVLTNMPCASIFLPMYRDGSYSGMFGIDLELDSIQAQILSGADSEQDTYTFILDGDGVVIAHPNEEYIANLRNYKTMTQSVPRLDASGSPVMEAGVAVTVPEEFTVADDLRAVVQAVMAGESGAGIVTIDGTAYFSGYAPVALPGSSDSWSVITVANKAVSEQPLNQTLRVIIGATLACAAVAMVIIFVLISGITKPVSKISKVAEEIAAGKFDTQIDVYRGKNEIGVLVKSFDRLKSTVDSICSSTDAILSKAQHGDLRARIDEEYSGDFDKLKNSVNNIVDILTYFVREFSENIGKINACADAFDKSAGNITQGAQTQSGIVDHLTRSLDDLARTIQENTASTEEAAGRSDEAARGVSQTKENMIKMTEAMDIIEKHAQKITGIMKVIDEIASQTKLLSLNATIEAARAAGDAGKSFTVVADEVRTLAARSAEAAKETAALIETSNAQITAGHSFAEEAAEEFALFADGISNISEIINRVRVSSEGQAQALAQFQQGISEISQVAERNMALADENAADAEKLSSVARDMTANVEQYQF